MELQVDISMELKRQRPDQNDPLLFAGAVLKTFLDHLVILLQNHKLEIVYRNHILEQYRQQLG